MLKVSVRMVDGGYLEWSKSDAFYRCLLQLQRDGYKGKELVDNLITDDWGAPPQGMEIKGVLEDGTRVDAWIPYV